MLKNRLTYIFFLAGSFWLMAMYEGYYMAVIFRALLITPILFLVINFICAAFMSVSIATSEAEAVTGDYIKIRMSVCNKIPIPVQKMAIYYTVTDNFEKKKKGIVTTNLKMQESTDIYIRFEAAGARAGNITISKIYIYDILGLFRKKCKFNRNDVRYYIYPAHHESNIIVENRIVESGDAEEVYSTVRPGNDRSELFAIRDYREGDDVRDIHWKLSVKKDDILIKEYSLPLRQDINVIFDFHAYSAGDKDYMYMLLNRYFELLYSISTSLINSRCEHIIHSFGSGRKDMMRVSVGEDMSDRDIVLKDVMYSCKITENAKKEFGPDELRGNIIYVSAGIDAEFLREAASFGRIKKIVIICIGKSTDRYVKEAGILAEEMYEAGCNAEFVFSDISETIEEMRTFTI